MGKDTMSNDSIVGKHGTKHWIAGPVCCVQSAPDQLPTRQSFLD